MLHAALLLALLPVPLQSSPPPIVAAAEEYRAGRAACDARRFAEAGPRFDAAAELAPGLALEGNYSAACAHARAGELERARAALERALGAGWRDRAALDTDPDLAPLRGLEDWKALAARASENDARFRRERSDPERAHLVLDDVEHLAALAARIPKDASLESFEELLRREYYARGSRGLGDFLAFGKIQSEEQLAGTILALPRFYGALEPALGPLRGEAQSIRAAFRRFRELVPDAYFPDVYFVVGHFRSGGTSSANGLMIGTEIYSRCPTSVLDELPEENRGIVEPVSHVRTVVIHELTHFQQAGGGAPSLLRSAIVEGSADYVAQLVLPEEPEPSYRVWGREHAQKVRERFLAERGGTDTSEWIANNDRAREDWPAVLGYYVGFEIARGFCESKPDRRAALAELLRLADPEAILAASGYAR